MSLETPLVPRSIDPIGTSAAAPVHAQDANISATRLEFDTAWTQFVSTQYSPTDPIGQVTRYILEAPGKRVRAMLCLMVSHACDRLSAPGTSSNQAMRAAMAVEMVHAYSLVHDDLPCMDDDDMRRGRKTAHIVYDEARALLAGDGLLADAFLVLTRGAASDQSVAKDQSASSAALVHELASACGTRGMVWGQALDLHWTGRSGAGITDLLDIHSTKTAWLLGAACAMGAIATGASRDAVEQWRKFGRFLGLAFQVVDDLLDESPTTGKTAGKDKDVGKLTFPALIGIEKSREMADELTTAALEILRAQPGPTEELRLMTHTLLHREH